MSCFYRVLSFALARPRLTGQKVDVPDFKISGGTLENLLIPEYETFKSVNRLR